MAKKIMIQGTGSSVGKSIVVAGLCRIFNDLGIKVAPFKSQNMALNSFITKDGFEMGRAQVVQAEASRIEPSVNMNPVLLKPTSDVGCQVIVNGVVYKNVKAAEYFTLKEQLIPEVEKAFKVLDEAYELIVIEGAGSPAEINLRSRDIVNMGLAELVDSDVILVGDVDKGGVFASLYGTIALLEENERSRIKGFIINKFRGDVALLKPGIDMLIERIGIPCLGVLPYIKNLEIDDEDSVTERFKQSRKGVIVVGVIHLPYLSNFSDFTCFEHEPNVNLVYLEHPEDLKICDLIVIPGSKNTLNDMLFLSLSGFQNALYEAHKNNIPIIGICGGYQMLGFRIQDPDGVESDLKSLNGLGLLNVNTVLLKHKTTRQAMGTIIEGSFDVTGYEIHMGVTERMDEETKPFIVTDEGTYDGAIDPSGRVVGTYFHGIFDNDAYRKSILDALLEKKGLKSLSSTIDFKALKEQEYNRLASEIKPYLDLDMLQKIIEESRVLKWSE